MIVIFPFRLVFLLVFGFFICKTSYNDLIVPASLNFQDVDSLKYDAYHPISLDFGNTPDLDPSSFDQHRLGSSIDTHMSLTIAQKQKFTIREISPDWCFSSDGAKVMSLKSNLLIIYYIIYVIILGLIKI